MDERESVVELTRALVAARSDAEVGEREAIEVARPALERLGFQDITIDDVGNLSGRMPGTDPDAGCLVFDGHIDTVGITDSSAWSHDPYMATEREGRLYGRGVADMKGAIASMAHAIARLRYDPIATDVVLSISIAEEMVEGYALGHVLEFYGPKAVVIGEATNLDLARAQRGRAEVLVETFGVPAHSSTPHLGRNAIKPMATLVGLLSNLPMPEDELFGPAVLEVTDIMSHPYPGLSVIPDYCRATFDRRMLVGETEEDVLSEIQGILEGLLADDHYSQAKASIAIDHFTTWNGYELIAPNCARAWRMDDDAPIVEAAMGALIAAGLAPEMKHYDFCTNGSESARRGIPTIGFGPGHEGEAHRIDESIDIAHLFAAVEGYEMLARELSKL